MYKYSTFCLVVLCLVSSLILLGCPPSAPSVDFTGIPTTGVAPLDVQFTDTSIPGTSAITEWVWDFGDGETSNQQNPSHTYSNEGMYTVSLMVTYDLGHVSEAKEQYITVTAAQEEPNANFTASAISGTVPLEVSFTDTSDPGTENILGWVWDFGDNETSTQQNPSHTYTSEGTYTVSLTATSAIGSDSVIKEEYIVVSPAPVTPDANFTMSPQSGSVPLEVAFTDVSKPGTESITTWAWEFGDGETSNQQNPSHTYTTEGIYTVSLEVTSAIGTDSETKQECVVVAPVLEDPFASFITNTQSGTTPLEVVFTDTSVRGSEDITGWSWNFGDGATSLRQNPRHTYTREGSFTVSLTVTSAVGSNNVTKDDFIVTVAPTPEEPEADFTADQRSGDIPLTVAFTDISSSGSEEITEWNWDFGDGSTSSEQNPTHTYTEVGTFNISLTVTSSVGSNSSHKPGYIITSQPEVTVPNITNMPRELAENVLYSADLSVGTVSEQYHDTVTAERVISQNPASGTRIPTESAVNLIVSLGPEPPSADFTSNVQSGDVPLTVAFTDTSSQGSLKIFAWRWYFGDGATSSEQNPTHTYTRAGTFTVSLDVLTSVGSDNIQKPDYITAFSAEVLVPDITDMTQTAAEDTLVSAGLNLGIVSEQYHDTITVGHVITQNPSSGTQVTTESSVDLVLSMGPKPADADLTVDVNAISLTADAPIASFQVSNAGDLALEWTSSTINPISVVPASGTLQSGESQEVLLIPSDITYYGFAQVKLSNRDIVADNESMDIFVNLQGETTELEGTWVGIDVDEDEPTISISGQTWKTPFLLDNSEAWFAGTFVLDTTTNPKRFDRVLLDVSPATVSFPYVGEVVPGIYELDGASCHFGFTAIGSNITPENFELTLVKESTLNDVAVPDVVGITQSEAEIALNDIGLAIGEVSTDNSDTVPEGSIISQSPAASTIVTPRSPVDIVVSEGPEHVVITETILLPGDVPLEMVWIEPGTFLMGRNEYSTHQVTFSQGFWMGKYEVTQAQWSAIMGTTPWRGKLNVQDVPNAPAVYLGWSNAQTFIATLNENTDKTFRLPSEAEWEYACRAGTTTNFYWGDDPTYTVGDKYTWWKYNAFDFNEIYAHLVGQKLPNAWGLYDMSGNVYEWCQDCYHDTYVDAPTDGTAWESPASNYYILRGGNFYSEGERVQSWYRVGVPDYWPEPDVGFRLAATTID